jgi:hypothetical protein
MKFFLLEGIDWKEVDKQQTQEVMCCVLGPNIEAVEKTLESVKEKIGIHSWVSIFCPVAQSASGLQNGECRVDGRLLIGYVLCVINSSRTIETLHSCYGHIEDVHVTFWKFSDIFQK